MRIIVAGPPKTGNIWIKCLLAEIYHLEILYSPPNTDAEFKLAVEEGWFPEGSIFHQHFPPSSLFLETTSELGCALVTMIRNPYDTFVSLYYFVQNFPKMYSRPGNQLNRIYGKAIDHPDIYSFLRDTSRGYGVHILSAKNWLDSGASVMLRYEDLKATPMRVLAEVTARIRESDESALQSALETCSVENMKNIFSRYRKHVRKGSVGDWRNHLNADHLAAIQTHSAWIEALGYQVIEPESVPQPGADRSGQKKA